jgi:predicted GNAT superfamily acetyltransferase
MESGYDRPTTRSTVDSVNTRDTVNIRDTVTDDLDAALRLNNVNLPELNELDLAEITRLHGLALDGGAALTAELAGRFAGFCLVYPPGVDYGSLNYRWFSERYDRFVYLDHIAVDTSVRRSGAGRAMYAELVQRFTGVWPVLLCEVNVRPRNDASLDFHHSIGFREVGRQDTDGGNKTVSLLALEL